jgi:hypothetical protein
MNLNKSNPVALHKDKKKEPGAQRETWRVQINFFRAREGSTAERNLAAHIGFAHQIRTMGSYLSVQRATTKPRAAAGAELHITADEPYVAAEEPHAESLHAGTLRCGVCLVIHWFGF